MSDDDIENFPSRSTAVTFFAARGTLRLVRGSGQRSLAASLRSLGSIVCTRAIPGGQYLMDFYCQSETPVQVAAHHPSSRRRRHHVLEEDERVRDAESVHKVPRCPVSDALNLQAGMRVIRGRDWKWGECVVHVDWPADAGLTLLLQSRRWPKRGRNYFPNASWRRRAGVLCVSLWTLVS